MARSKRAEDSAPASGARSRFAIIPLGSPSPLSFVPLCVLRGYPQSWQKEAASPPFTPRAGGGARTRFAIIPLGSPSPLSFVPLCVLRGYPQSWQKEAASPPFHTPRRRQCPVQICGHLPGIAVSAFLRAPLCPSWISSKLAKGSRIAPPSHPAPAAVRGPDLRSSPWDRRLRFPSCPFVSFVDILKAGQRKPHRPLHTPRRRRSAVQICNHPPGIAVSAFLRAPLCPSWISLKLAKGSRIAPLHTPRRRRCPDQICDHPPGIAVSAFLRAPLCPSWISSKLAKGSRIAPLHTPRRRRCAVQNCGHLSGIAVSAFLRAPLCPSWISLKLAKGSRIAPLHTPPPFRVAPSPTSRATASELGQSTAMLPCPLPYPDQTL